MHFFHVHSYLLKQGADIRAKDKSGYTAFTHACIRSNISPSIYQLLLSHGADTTAIHCGLNYLMIAIMKRDISLLKLLLLTRPNCPPRAWVNGQAWHGHTALHVACLTHYPEAVSVLLEAGADPRALNDDGKAAWEIAFTQRDEACASLMLVSSR